MPTSILLSSLHWLPVKSRITYKIACLTHTALHDHQPSYIAQLLHSHTPTRCLRSSDQLLLTIPRTHFQISDRSFDVAAPKIWNSLPFDLRNLTSSGVFRGKLKTHLFDQTVT